jgi:hypothetical protein
MDLSKKYQLFLNTQYNYAEIVSSVLAVNFIQSFYILGFPTKLLDSSDSYDDLAFHANAYNIAHNTDFSLN